MVQYYILLGTEFFQSVTLYFSGRMVYCYCFQTMTLGDSHGL